MQYARRMAKLRPSATIALGAVARRLSMSGKPIYNLAGGEPGYPAPRPVVEAAQRVLANGDIRYSVAGGTDRLRSAIVAKYQRENQLDYDIDEVVVGCGAKEVLLHSFMSILNKGDEVILFAPYWLSYREQIGVCEAHPVIVPYDSNQPMPTVARLQQYATARTKAIVFNFPNNPCGYVPNRAEYEALGEYLQRKGWWVISDEIYEYLVFARDRQHCSILNVCPQLREQTILINGFSKGFAMTGWRVGYALGNKELISNVKKLQSHSTTCLPAFTEHAAIVAINGGKPLVQEMITAVGAKLQKMQQLLGEIECLRFTPPQGALYVFARLPDWLAQTPHPTALAFAAWLLEQHHVAVVPSESFGVAGCVRISCTAPPAIIQQGVELLAQSLHELQKSSATGGGDTAISPA